MIQAVIFDLDGMLLRGERFSDAYAREFGVDTAVLFDFFFGPFQRCVVGQADLKEELTPEWLSRWKWKGTVDELLDYWFSTGNILDTKIVGLAGALRARGVRTGLATNQEKYRREFVKREHRLPELFDDLFISSEMGTTKPTEPFFDEMSKRLGFAKADILLCDDRPAYADAALRCGFPAFLYTEPDAFDAKLRRLRLL